MPREMEKKIGLSNKVNNNLDNFFLKKIKVKLSYYQKDIHYSNLFFSQLRHFVKIKPLKRTIKTVI